MAAHRARGVASLLLSSGLVALAASGPARAEWAFGVYLGVASTGDTDVTLSRPPDTSLEFADVSWTDDSLVSPVYYGIRVTRWLESAPAWGVAVDYTHAKMFAELDRSVPVRGTRDGAPVSGVERLGDTFAGLSFSHGHNLLTVNGCRRWRDAAGRLAPYVGLGVGIALPHAEVVLDGSTTDSYQRMSAAAEALAGLDVRLSKRVGLLVEYKLTRADFDASLDGGGSLTLRPWTQQIALGVTFRP